MVYCISFRFTWFVKWYNFGSWLQHQFLVGILVYHLKTGGLQVLYQKYEADSILSVTLPKEPRPKAWVCVIQSCTSANIVYTFCTSNVGICTNILNLFRSWNWISKKEIRPEPRRQLYDEDRTWVMIYHLLMHSISQWMGTSFIAKNQSQPSSFSAEKEYLRISNERSSWANNDVNHD